MFPILEETNFLARNHVNTLTITTHTRINDPFPMHFFSSRSQGSFDLYVEL